MSGRALIGGGVALALIAALVVATVAFLGDDEDSAVLHTDGAFIAEMIPHHASAVEMAAIAIDKAEREEIREMATEIIDAQREEMRELRAIHRRLFGDRPPDSPFLDHGTLGLSHEEMGMDHDGSALQGADPFDREFIDMMIPHHQGAIRMARIQLERGQDPELKRLSRTIIDDQSREIRQMSAWRERWYGEPPPSGSVPDEGEAPSHEDMGH